MATKFVSRCRITRNGQKVADLKNYTEDDIDLRGVVSTMESTGTYEKTKKYGFKIDQVIAKTGAKHDWSDAVDETWTIELDGGHRTTFTEVSCINQGGVKTDGESESVRTLTFCAVGKVDE
jgi:hypothetical protein